MDPTYNLYGFPKQDSHSLSHWLQDAQGDPLLHHRTTPTVPQKADIVIIGSGMTGTLVAKHCVETWPKKTIVVLEARGFCSGATGRNAGHCKPDQWRGFVDYEKAFGTEQALKILQNEQQTWSGLVKYVRDNNVDCDLWVGETFDVPLTPEVAAVAKNKFERFVAAGGKIDHIKFIKDPIEAAKVSRIKDAQACYAWPASTLHPWKLSAHIMRENLKKGINLQTNTKVNGVVKSSRYDGKLIVKTERGNILASQVVHATNAYSSALESTLRGLIHPSPHMCDKVIPPDTLTASKSLKNSYGILLPNGGLFSINPQATTSGPVLFGGLNPGQQGFEDWLRGNPEKCIDDDLKGFPSVTKAVREFTESQLVGWEDKSTKKANYDHRWSGIIGLSADGVPFVGELPGLPGQWRYAAHKIDQPSTTRMRELQREEVEGKAQLNGERQTGVFVADYETCLVEDPATKKHRPRDYLETLEQRVAFLEGVLRQYRPELANDHLYQLDTPRPESQSSSSLVAQPIINQFPNPRTEEVDDEHGGLDQLASKVGLLSLNAAGAEPHYLGSSSTFAFSRLINSSLRQVVFTNSSNTTSIGQNEDVPPVLPSPCLLPDHETAVKLSNAYFENIHTQYPFLHEPTFRLWEATIVTGSAEFETLISNPVPLFFLNMVYAVGAVLLPNVGYSAERLYISAQMYIDLYSLRSSIGTSHWKLAGLALRQCIDLGYHRNSKRFRSTANPLRLELSKRVFWCAYVMETQAAVMLGRPQSIAYQEVDAEQLRVEIDTWRADIPPALPSAGEALSLFTTPDWYDMEYNYTILQLYRVQIIDGQEGTADAVFLDCLRAAEGICHGYRRQYLGKQTSYTWSALHELFLAGLTYLHCLWTSPAAREAHRQGQVSSTCTDCTIVLVLMAERWDTAAPYRDIFETLASRTMTMMDDRTEGKPTSTSALDDADAGGEGDLMQWMTEMADGGMSEGFNGLLSSLFERNIGCYSANPVMGFLSWFCKDPADDFNNYPRRTPPVGRSTNLIDGVLAESMCKLWVQLHTEGKWVLFKGLFFDQEDYPEARIYSSLYVNPESGVFDIDSFIDFTKTQIRENNTPKYREISFQLQFGEDSKSRRAVGKMHATLTQRFTEWDPESDASITYDIEKECLLIFYLHRDASQWKIQHLKIVPGTDKVVPLEGMEASKQLEKELDPQGYLGAAQRRSGFPVTKRNKSCFLCANNWCDLNHQGRAVIAWLIGHFSTSELEKHLRIDDAGILEVGSTEFGTTTEYHSCWCH
ncbi:hypothetical protein G7046_g2644 [Stylonectria norvegica]|nr:hypothetical protein G7046_g2644 [Stylonectria norvegica]